MNPIAILCKICYYIKEFQIAKLFCAKKECVHLFLKGDICMGISYRKRIKVGDGVFLNISKRGVSISKKVGNTTINSKGAITINLGNGIIYRMPKKKK